MLKKLTPKEIAMDIIDVLKDSDSYDQRHYFHSCGTPACIAGHIAHRHGWENADSSAYGCAMILLGLNGDEAAKMFNGFPMDITGHASKEDAIAMLQHWVETGEVEWNIET